MMSTSQSLHEHDSDDAADDTVHGDEREKSSHVIASATASAVADSRNGARINHRHFPGKSNDNGNGNVNLNDVEVSEEAEENGVYNGNMKHSDTTHSDTNCRTPSNSMSVSYSESQASTPISAPAKLMTSPVSSLS